MLQNPHSPGNLYRHLYPHRNLHSPGTPRSPQGPRAPSDLHSSRDPHSPLGIFALGLALFCHRGTPLHCLARLHLMLRLEPEPGKR